jgi:hypothetical protein
VHSHSHSQVYFNLGWPLSTIALAWLATALVAAAATYMQLPSWRWLQDERVRVERQQQQRGSSLLSEAEYSSLYSSLPSLPARGLTEAMQAPLPKPLSRSPIAADGWAAREAPVADVVARPGVAAGASAARPATLLGAEGDEVERRPEHSPPPTPGSLSILKALHHRVCVDSAAADEETPEELHTQALVTALQVLRTGSHDERRLAAEAEAAAALVPMAVETSPAFSHEWQMVLSLNPVSPSRRASREDPLSRPTNRSMHRRLLRSQMLRTDTLLLMMTMAFANLKATYYIVSFSEDARVLFPPEVAERLDVIFNVGFPMGSLISSPLTSLLLRRFRKRPDVYMMVAVVGVNVVGLLTLSSHPLPQTVAVMLFGPSRTLLWSCYFHFLAQPNRFARATKGRMLGYSNLIIAVMSDLPPYLLNWCVTRFNGLTLATVHLLLQVALLGCLAFPVYLHACHHEEVAAKASSTATSSRREPVRQSSSFVRP